MGTVNLIASPWEKGGWLSELLRRETVRSAVALNRPVKGCTFVVSTVEGRSGDENGLLARWWRRPGKVPSCWGAAERGGKRLPGWEERLWWGGGGHSGTELHPWTLGHLLGGGGLCMSIWGGGLTQAVSQERDSLLHFSCDSSVMILLARGVSVSEQGPGYAADLPSLPCH